MHVRPPNESLTAAPGASGAIPAIDVFGMPFALLNYESTASEVLRLAGRATTGAAAFCNTQLLAEARAHPEFHQALGSFDLRVPDGMPVVWLMNALGGRMRDRVYGPYFMRHLVQNAPASCRHFLFGGSPECLAQLEAALRRMRPDIALVGTLSPPYRAWVEEDEAGFARAINDAKPDLIWVALGGVKQENWIARNRHRYSRGVFLAVGDAFELLAGRRAFAPAWMQRLGLTWVYRLIQEPGRLWKRYLVYNSVFAFYAAIEIGRRLLGRRG